MPLSIQGKILRVIQERTIERLGSLHTIPIDIQFLRDKVELVAKAAVGGDEFTFFDLAIEDIAGLLQR